MFVEISVDFRSQISSPNSLRLHLISLPYSHHSRIPIRISSFFFFTDLLIKPGSAEMGNSFGCSASGERLVSAARDGDLVEAKMLLDCNPSLANYSTFGGLNSPLHFAAAKGHTEIVALLLENGADVNSRNYCGQTALMQACRYGRWEVVQTLLLFKCNVTRADYLNGRTALHFAAVHGHVRCVRLLLSDYVPSAPFEAVAGRLNGEPSEGTASKKKCDHSALSKFVNKAADGGITALHMAALNGYFDCIQLLLDLHANVSAVTFHYGTTMDMIGAGSTPLHYAACGGNLKCCQILLARGASKLSLNCNGWLPADVGKMWGRHWLEQWLAPNSDSVVPDFPPSNFLSLPLMSVLAIARESGLQSSAPAADTAETCAVCLERACSVAAEGCGHALCVRCALYLCSTCNIPAETADPPGSIPCPLCRHGIVSFLKLPGPPAKEIKLHASLGLCTPCMVNPRTEDHCTSEIRKNRVASVSSDIFCPISCTPFPSVAIPSCTSPSGACLDYEAQDSEGRDGSPAATCTSEQAKFDEQRMGTPTCSSMLWGRRSCSREQQCNSEISHW
uniref:RING-type E3 ubiquitin transferase n=2 Tax=Kalanchoe fedtschenkoi TaxID=63787 RepID=A0A7N0R8X1_KALFE